MRLTRFLKDGFVAGIILIAPLVVTLYVLNVLAGWSLGVIDPVVAETRLVQYVDVRVAAQVVAVVLILAAITVLGIVAQWSVGQHLFGNIGRTVYVIPLISTIYGSVRQVATSLVERDSQFKRVVIVEYPRKGVYSIGLVTGDSVGSIDDVAGDSAYPVFLPNSPNPTAGRLVMVPDPQLHETDMSVREAMRMIVTTGIGSESEDLDAYDLMDEQFPDSERPLREGVTDHPDDASPEESDRTAAGADDDERSGSGEHETALDDGSEKRRE